MPDVSPFSISWTGYVFDKDSPLYVGLIHRTSGIVPDGAIRSKSKTDVTDNSSVPDTLSAGWFTDTMPQTLITNVVQYGLDVVIFSGHEKALLLDNLRRTLIPDLRKKLLFVKRIAVRCAADIRLADDYQSVADYILFDFVDEQGRSGWCNLDTDILSAYQGEVPFIIGARYDERQTVMSSLPDDARFAGITLHL